jgi:hypothetical protein
LSALIYVSLTLATIGVDLLIPSNRQLPFQQHYRTLADVGDAVVRSYPLSSKGKSEIRTVFVPEQLIPT